MSILSQSKRLEAKLDFFNRQPPEIQAGLLATGYFLIDELHQASGDQDFSAEK